MRPLKIASVLLIIAFSVFSCKEFTSYNLTADAPGETADIHGTVTNKFTNLPVAQARIQIGNYTTYSDKNGAYSIVYGLQADEERDKPVPVLVQAQNFYSYQTNIIIYPQSTPLDFLMTYGAPLITENAFVPYLYHANSVFVCQVEVLDYQGVDDIDTVEVTFHYKNQEDGSTQVYRTIMDRIKVVSENSAYYQSIASASNEPYVLLPSYEVRATDREGFSTSISDYFNSMAPDNFLFPPP